MIDVGSSFLKYHPIHSNHPNKKKHLFVVVNKIIHDENNKEIAICFYLTTVNNNGNEDLSCVFERGEHEFITHKSYIDYSTPLYVLVETLEYEEILGQVTMKAPFTEDQVGRIISGANKSDSIRPSHLKYLS